ncbi:ABC transporter permease [Mycoplasma struthionis]|uniref:ABC transporter permease n=2 Tax=Mycoplasma struthionis TaxID=538220 RepID=A0A3G8LIQ5_9MOLU|nr:ABC transporter permease [Mycoplasma struthionis]
MFRYIRQRIVFAILALFIISIFVFVMIYSFGPSPIHALAEQKFSDPKNTKPLEQIISSLEVQNGLRYGTVAEPGEKIPVLVLYFRYLKGIFVDHTFGFLIDSKNNPNPAAYKTMSQLFFNPLKYSLLITVPSFIFSSIVGITIGIFAGYNRGKWFDSSSNIFVLIFIGVPSFIIAPMVISLSLRIGVPVQIPRASENAPFSVLFVAYLPPIIVMSLGSLAGYVTYTRNQVITVLTSNYVLIAKTKGLSSTQIFFKYVLRNISIPLFSLIFGSFLGLLSGSIVIERYWNVQGTSQIIANSFPTGEFNVVMFSTLFFTFIGLIAEIIVDLSFAILDPKITYAARSKKNYWLFFKAYLERRKLAKDLLSKNNQNLETKGV